MKTTEDVGKYAAEQGIAEDETLKQGMEEKSKEFVETRMNWIADISIIIQSQKPAGVDCKVASFVLPPRQHGFDAPVGNESHQGDENRQAVGNPRTHEPPRPT